jgi:cell division septation protein DedD
MDDDFNPDDLRPIPYRPDTELMLGPWMMGGVCLVLILLCGLCFSVGYSLGKHSAHNAPAAGEKQSSQVTPLVGGSGAKPSASSQAGYRARPAPDSQSASTGTSAASPATSPASVLPVPTATAPAPTLMVQIAAVSHQEDADVLIGALRKRGYAVNVHRDPADNLLHVRIGPFASRDDANATRMKLLNDGYNASLQ